MAKTMSKAKKAKPAAKKAKPAAKKAKPAARKAKSAAKKGTRKSQEMLSSVIHIRISDKLMRALKRKAGKEGVSSFVRTLLEKKF